MLFRSLASPRNISLIVLGGASTFLYRHALSIEGAGAGRVEWFIRVALCQGAVYLAACLIAWKARPCRSTLYIILIFAALFRLSILFSPPLLSDDVYRYVWDGRVQSAGINPYKYIPADENLQALRDPVIYPKINRRDYAPTMYPPGAETIFLLTTRLSESVTWMKATMVAFESITVWALVALLASLGLSRQRVLIYAWHPLIVWEFAGSGHLDAIAIAFVALALLARRRHLEFATGALLACATLVKLFPAILFPALYRRWGWKMPAVFLGLIMLAYAPYVISIGAHVALGYLPGYLREEGMTSGDRYFILALARSVLGGIDVPQIAFFAFATCVLSVLAFWSLRKQAQSGHGFIWWTLALAAAFTVLLSPRYPWYFTWLIPFLCFVPALSLFYLTAASFTLYGLWLSGGSESIFKINSFLYLPAGLMAVSRNLILLARSRQADHRSPKSAEEAQLGRPGGADAKESSLSWFSVAGGAALDPSAREGDVPGNRSSELSTPPAKVSVVIPCLNEEQSIAEVVRAVRRENVSEVIVVDNDSKDRTAEQARAAGARVVREPTRGYGSACHAGFRACTPDCDVVVFLDGDGCDRPELMWRLVDPILKGTHDFVISSRLRGLRERGSMYFPQVVAGHLIGLILRILYRVHYTDMGPFRAIRRSALERLAMREMTYGWPLEMQMRAAQARLRILEVPVDYRRRHSGQSKISGTLTGTVLATTRILLTLARVALKPLHRAS